ncbi:hypothetical protein MM300_20310 [Evansella sp. LMS18]|uniref:hypothetical protein n=1 Tax=Evansella sp. LMS18 TaxID=2924033 RepID=UPI0020D02283|nr:hypothetical protein [Evansella sp. LMS18]UTR10193.1 hypothetical protein MM300_20310 [Evansella sp. LMS18]
MEVVEIFEKNINYISSSKYKLPSNQVLGILTSDLESINFHVEKSKKSSDKIRIPVLFGRNGGLDLAFEADAFNQKTKTVIEVEAGRAVDNYQFLKDLFQASMMHDVDHLVIAVRNLYRQQKDFEKVNYFLDALYSSERLKLPFKGVLIVGY